MNIDRIKLTTFISLIAFIGPVASWAAASKMNIPDFAPDNSEVTIRVDPSTIFNIKSIEEFASQRGWILGKSRLTKSSIFGAIYRIDFKTAGVDGDLLNRVIVWKRADGVENIQMSIGQKGAKL